jgi:hypothetical protein
VASLYTMAREANGTTRTGATASSSSTGTVSQSLNVRFPVNTAWEFVLQNEAAPVSGTVYCTDEVSQTIVLLNSLVHTTLASEIRVVHLSGVISSKSIKATPESGLAPLSHPLPKVQKKSLEERERRALRLAEESLRHINQKATVQGQAVFDRLLKACNEVVWKGESIIVLNQVQVDPPYGLDDCKTLQQSGKKKGALEEDSLDRVKKIVSSGIP